MNQISTTSLPVALPKSLPPEASLADVMAFVIADPDITVTQRRGRLSAMRVLARTLDKEPRLITVAPAALAKQLQSVVPVAHGITARRWADIRSRTLSAIAQAGIKVIRGRSATDLTPEWRQLDLALPTQTAAKIGLSRFMRFCTDQDVPPDDVDDTVFDRFRAALQTQSVVTSPHRVHRTSCDQWNKASQIVPGWPAVRVRLPANPRHYSFAWSDFPASFAVDVEAFLKGSSNPNPFADDYIRPLRPATVNLRRRQIRQMASFLVQADVPIAQVINLATLVEVAHARKILEICHKRVGKGSVQLHAMALLLKGIAQQWVKAPAETIGSIAGYARAVAVPTGQMTEKNRRRLRQFDDPGNVSALLDLPDRIFKSLKKYTGPVDRAVALRAMNALAIELLIVAPMRIANLTSLDLNRHVIKIGRAPGGIQHIVIPPQETKTKIPYEMVIPAETAALMATYRKLYLPLITREPTTLLFPNEQGQRRWESALARSMTEFLRRETGLIMNVHLFRHTGITLYLREHPEDLETARRVLGHSNIDITGRKYADIKTAAAFERYDRLIGNMRAALRSGHHHKSTRRGG